MPMMLMPTIRAPLLLLHIEDDPDDVYLIGSALTQAGVEIPIHVMTSGMQAMDYLMGKEPYHNRDEHPLPNLILLDLNLPYMSGHEFLRWLRDQPGLRRIPVVVLTSSNAELDMETAYDAGANAYLVKPLAYAELKAMLKDLRAFWLTWNQPN
jgi:CheY-like chemotaxis protein